MCICPISRNSGDFLVKIKLYSLCIPFKERYIKNKEKKRKQI